MPKILKDTEMLDILSRAVKGEEIDCADSYVHFLEDLALLICDHFGGSPGNVGHPDFEDPRLNIEEAARIKKSGELGWTVGFHVNECVPEDGGVFREYDRDITWNDGVELEN